MPTTGAAVGVKGPTKAARLSRQTRVHPTKHLTTVGIGCMVQLKTSDLFAGHGPTRGLGQLKNVYNGSGGLGSARVGSARLGSGRVRSDRVGSGQEFFKLSRVGSHGSDRVTLIRLGLT